MYTERLVGVNSEQAYIRAAPERVVWGSDWPHPTEKDQKPDDAVLFDLVAAWAPDEATRHRIDTRAGVGVIGVICGEVGIADCGVSRGLADLGLRIEMPTRPRRGA